MNLRGEYVLVPVNLNVPLLKGDRVTVTDDTPLRAIVPMTKFLLNKGANVILCSHFGRTKGEIVEMGKNSHFDPVVGPLKKLLGVDVVKADNCIGPEADASASPLGGGAEGPAFGEHPLPRGGDEERYGPRCGTREVGRLLRHGRVRDRPSRSLVHGGGHLVSQAERRGIPLGQGTHVSQGCGQRSGTTAVRDHRRCKGVSTKLPVIKSLIDKW